MQTSKAEAVLNSNSPTFSLPGGHRAKERASMKTVHAWTALAISTAFLGRPNEASATVIPNGTDAQVYKNYGGGLTADNGGPAVTLQIFSSDYVGVPDSNYFMDQGLITSGTIGGRDVNGKIIIYGDVHTLNTLTTPDKITGIKVYTGRNIKNNTSPVLNVDMRSLRIAAGADGTLNTLGLFGAKLDGDIPGLGNITIGSSSPGQTLVAAGSGFIFQPAQAADNTIPPRSFDISAFNSKVDSFAPVGANDAVYNATIFGADAPVEGKIGKLTGGDSNEPFIKYDSITYSESGRFLSGTLVGIGVAQTGNGDPSGTSIYTDFGYAQSSSFTQSFSVPEPAILSVVAVAGFLTLKRQRKS